MFRNETGHWGLDQGQATTPITPICAALLPLLLSLLPLPSFAASDYETSAPISDSYYEIREQIHSTPAQSPVSMSPVDLLSVGEAKEFDAELMKAKTAFFSLLDWDRHPGAAEAPHERYNRRRQFGTWKIDPHDGSCLDVRGQVLQRDSETRVATRESRNRCVVVSGRWVDPYSGQTYTSASEIDIDHMVPLKNAYDNGGWRWSAEKRCHYFNFVESKGHLLSVSQRENSAKGDSSPADYLPPLRSAQCGYLKNWLSIKLTWGLTLPAHEADAIREHIQQLGCDQNDFVIPKTDLEQVRRQLDHIPSMCDDSFQAADSIPSV